MPELAPEMDGSFLALPLHACADAALSRAIELGARHVSLRIGRTRHDSVLLRDASVLNSSDTTYDGLAVRLTCNGVWGFAATTELTADAAADCTERAVRMALMSAPMRDVPVELADEPGYGERTWISAYEVNPFELPKAERAALLIEWSRRLLAAPEVDHVRTKLSITLENKFYADLAGTSTIQQSMRVHPQLVVMARHPRTGITSTLRTIGPPSARGWEYLAGDGWDWEAELAEMPALLAEKSSAPTLEQGDYDLVIHPSNLWLTIHETVGHATETDRALGHEAGYAGTSFVTVDAVGSMRYGSDLMCVTGDRTAEHGLATVGFDDEGVAAQSFDLVRDGVLVGLQLDRHTASLTGAGRSNGCAYADSALDAPLARMPNVSLRPARPGFTTEELIGGVEDGVYIVGSDSWSIDMQRRNFQFGAQRCHRIRHGRLAGQLRDVGYLGETREFWSALSALGGPDTYQVYGADLCGKGQPMQTSAASHGAPAALFKDVRVNNAAREAGL